eukprot:COSAG01_NODE_9348_length_2473_cov_2.390059_1_plen_81_part_00
MLVSYAFRRTCNGRWEGRILVLLHNCCMQSAHYCASTNFHVNEYIAVWFDANGFAVQYSRVYWVYLSGTLRSGPTKKSSL